MTYVTIAVTAVVIVYLSRRSSGPSGSDAIADRSIPFSVTPPRDADARRAHDLKGCPHVAACLLC